MIRSAKITAFAILIFLIAWEVHAGEALSVGQGHLLLSYSNSEERPQAAHRLERRIRERINGIRKRHGLRPLEGENALDRAARSHSCRMASEGFFSHRTPSGQTSVDRLRQVGLAFSLFGENIGMTSGIADPLDRLVEGWMKSKGHRENILNPRFTQTGVGVCKRGDAYFVTQVFRRP